MRGTDPSLSEVGMAYIPVGSKDGLVAFTLVDADCEAMLTEGYPWYLSTRGYVMRQAYLGRRNGRPIREVELMHRVVMGLEKGDGKQVDHMDRDKLHNRRENLRVVTAAQNNQNLPGGHGQSGIHGVHWNSKRNHWMVRVRRDGKMFWGGSFATLEEAAPVARELRRRVLPYSTD